MFEKSMFKMLLENELITKKEYAKGITYLAEEEIKERNNKIS